MIDRNQLLKPVLRTIPIPELEGEVSIRTLSQGEAQIIADRYADPDGEDAEKAGRDIVYASLVNDDGTPLLDDPAEVAQMPAPVLQRILNEIGFGETAISGN